MKKVYLKIATRALAIGALINEGAKYLWEEPLKKALEFDMESAHYRTAARVGLYLVSLLVVYKVVEHLMLRGFDASWSVRRWVDKLFDVEGTYLERVYINDELEVVGINHVGFVEGELSVVSELYWPRRHENGHLYLTKWARTTSVEDLCTASETELRYAFEDHYLLKSGYDKTGFTKLALQREQHPSWWKRTFWRSPIVGYSGGFSSYENDIRGVIQGRRLTGKPLRVARSCDEKALHELLLSEVRLALKDRDLRTQEPGT